MVRGHETDISNEAGIQQTLGAASASSGGRRGTVAALLGQLGGGVSVCVCRRGRVVVVVVRGDGELGPATQPASMLEERVAQRCSVWPSRGG